MVHELQWMVFLCLGISVTITQDTSTYSKIEQFYNRKCYTHSQNAFAFDKLKSDAVEFEKFLSFSFSYIPHNKKHFCKNQRPLLVQRASIISKDLAPCLPYEEQFLPKFLKEAVEEFLHFLCHNNGENIDNFFSSQGQQCRQALEADNSLEVTQCFGKIFSPLQGYVKKQELCEDIKVAKKCFDQVIERKCPNFRGFKDLNENLFEYISKPCAACALNINNFLLLLMSVFSFYYFKL